MITAPVAVKICPDTADGKQIDKKTNVAGQTFPNLTGWVQIHLECVLACTCYLAIVLYKGLAYIDPHKALLPPMGEQQELQFSSSPLYDTQWHTSSYSPTMATPSADEFMPFVFVPHPHCAFFVCVCVLRVHV